MTTVLAVAVNKRATCAGGQTVSNEACCVLFPSSSPFPFAMLYQRTHTFKTVMEDLQSEDLMDNDCGDAAHGALRIAFHDAIGISQSAKTCVF
jgi:manganese peroxidase